MVTPAEHRVDNLEHALATLSSEVAAFVRESRTGNAQLRKEMADFKNEMADFKDEARSEARQLSRKLGEIAASQGRLVENIAAPSVPRVLRTLLDLPEDAELDFFAIRLKVKHPTEPGKNAEIDVVAAHGQSVLVVEVKAALTPELVLAHAQFLPQVRAFLPQFSGSDVIGAVASVYVDASLITYAERLGLLVLAAGDDLLNIQNQPGFVPRKF